jgi:hypothetical protein
MLGRLGDALDLLERILEGMAIIRITVKVFGSLKPTALAGGCHTILQPNSYRLCALPLLIQSTAGS